jgi:hypothetical protein
MFNNALTGLIPRLHNLREFCCRMVLSIVQFAAVVDYHATTLSSLAVSFNDQDMPQIAPLFNRLIALEDLHVWVPQIVGRGQLHQILALSKLRLLEIKGPESSTNSVLEWLANSSFPSLRTLRLQSTDKGALNLDILSSFLVINGANLTTFGYDGSLDSLTTAVFPHTPRLRYLELQHPFNSPSILQGLPISVTKVTLVIFGKQIGYYASTVHAIIVAVKYLPYGNKLSRLQTVSGRPYLGGDKFLFKTSLAGKYINRPTIQKLITRGAHLKELGVRLLDEDGQDLMDVVADMRLDY